MDREKLQSVYNTLSRYRSQYYSSSGRARLRIEESVRMYAEKLPGDIYVRLNQGSASGLFKSAFFRGDIDRSLSILEEELGK